MNKLSTFAILFLLLISSVFAQTIDLSQAKQYGLIESTYDRLNLIFTFNEQHRAEIISHIAERRSEHYQFLISQGKTDVAEKYLQKTESLIASKLSNLNQSIENKQRILDTIYNHTATDRPKLMIDKTSVPQINGRGY